MPQKPYRRVKMVMNAGSMNSRCEVSQNGSHSEHPYNLHRALERFERDYLHNILVLTQWDQASAATLLGIRVPTLEAKMKKYALLHEVRP
jgi:DNA-binding NtrC family response regulator